MFTFNKTLSYITLTCLLAIQGLSYATMKTQKVSVSMLPKSGSRVIGRLNVFETPQGLHIKGSLTGFEPNSKHGFHIHEIADCSSADAKSAGGHYDPKNQPHGGPNEKKSHAGDLGNVKADEEGVVFVDKIFRDLILYKSKPKVDKHPVLDRAIVVHKNADDLKSQPSGAAGARIACGEIVASTQSTSL